VQIRRCLWVFEKKDSLYYHMLLGGIHSGFKMNWFRLVTGGPRNRLFPLPQCFSIFLIVASSSMNGNRALSLCDSPFLKFAFGGRTWHDVHLVCGRNRRNKSRIVPVLERPNLQSDHMAGESLKCE
jgi:hypothetical protein